MNKLIFNITQEYPPLNT